MRCVFVLCMNGKILRINCKHTMWFDFWCVNQLRSPFRLHTHGWLINQIRQKQKTKGKKRWTPSLWKRRRRSICSCFAWSYFVCRFQAIFFYFRESLAGEYWPKSINNTFLWDAGGGACYEFSPTLCVSLSFTLDRCQVSGPKSLKIRYLACLFGISCAYIYVHMYVT